MEGGWPGVLTQDTPESPSRLLQHFKQAEIFQKIITTAAISYFPFFYLLVEGKSQ